MLRRLSTSWLYIAQSFITAAEVLRLGFSDARACYYRMKETDQWNKSMKATVNRAAMSINHQTMTTMRVPALSAALRT